MKKKTTMGPAPKFTGKRLEVRLSPEEREDAEIMAAKEGVSLSDFVRTAIREHVMNVRNAAIRRAWPK